MFHAEPARVLVSRLCWVLELVCGSMLTNLKKKKKRLRTKENKQKAQNDLKSLWHFSAQYAHSYTHSQICIHFLSKDKMRLNETGHFKISSSMLVYATKWNAHLVYQDSDLMGVQRRKGVNWEWNREKGEEAMDGWSAKVSSQAICLLELMTQRLLDRKPLYCPWWLSTEQAPLW